jgi:hypothetical protein
MNRRDILKGMFGTAVLAQPACAAIERVTRPKPTLEGKLDDVQRWSGKRRGMAHDNGTPIPIDTIDFSPNGDSGVILTKIRSGLHVPIFFSSQEELELYNFQLVRDSRTPRKSEETVRNLVWDNKGNAILSFYRSNRSQFAIQIDRESFVDPEIYKDSISGSKLLVGFGDKHKLRQVSLDQEGNLYASHVRPLRLRMYQIGDSSNQIIQLEWIAHGNYHNQSISPISVSPFGDFLYGKKRSSGRGSEAILCPLEREDKSLEIDVEEDYESFKGELKGWVVRQGEQYGVFTVLDDNSVVQGYKIWHTGDDPTETLDFQADHLAIPDNKSALYAVRGNDLYEINIETGTADYIRGLSDLTEGRDLRGVGVSSKGSLAVLSRDAQDGQFHFLMK